MLCFPPNWNPAMPHLALPTLTAFLRAHGVDVIQRDLNIEVFDLGRPPPPWLVPESELAAA